MARLSAKSAGLLLDEFDFSGVSNGVDLTVSAPAAEATAFADTAGVFIQGKAGFTATVNGLWSTASPNYDGDPIHCRDYCCYKYNSRHIEVN